MDQTSPNGTDHRAESSWFFLALLIPILLLLFSIFYHEIPAEDAMKWIVGCGGLAVFYLPLKDFFPANLKSPKMVSILLVGFSLIGYLVLFSKIQARISPEQKAVINEDYQFFFNQRSILHTPGTDEIPLTCEHKSEIVKMLNKIDMERIHVFADSICGDPDLENLSCKSIEQALIKIHKSVLDKEVNRFVEERATCIRLSALLNSYLSEEDHPPMDEAQIRQEYKITGRTTFRDLTLPNIPYYTDDRLFFTFLKSIHLFKSTIANINVLKCPTQTYGDKNEVLVKHSKL